MDTFAVSPTGPASSIGALAAAGTLVPFSLWCLWPRRPQKAGDVDFLITVTGSLVLLDKRFKVSSQILAHPGGIHALAWDDLGLWAPFPHFTAL